MSFEGKYSYKLDYYLNEEYIKPYEYCLKNGRDGSALHADQINHECILYGFLKYICEDFKNNVPYAIFIEWLKAHRELKYFEKEEAKLFYDEFCFGGKAEKVKEYELKPNQYTLGYGNYLYVFERVGNVGQHK